MVLVGSIPVPALTDTPNVPRDLTAMANALPWGVVGQVFRTNPLPAIPGGTTTDIPGMTVTFTAVANRRYRADYGCAFTASVIGQYCSLNLVDGSASGAGSVSIGVGRSWSFPHQVYATGYWSKARGNALAAGPVTVKLAVWIDDVGAAVAASARDPSFLVISDIGPDPS